MDILHSGLVIGSYISIMEEEKTKAEDFFEHVKEYIKTVSELLNLKITEKVSNIISDIASLIIIGIFFLFFLLFSSLALAYYLSDYFAMDLFLGFLFVAIAYFIIGSLFWLKRKTWFKLPIGSLLIREIFKTNN